MMETFATVAIVLFCVLLVVAVVIGIYATRWSQNRCGLPSGRHPCYGTEPKYIYLYNVGSQTGITGYVNFDSQGQTTPGFVHTVGGSTIVVQTGGGAEGVYSVEYTINPSTGITGGNQFGIYLNGAVNAGSVFDAANLNTEIVGKTIVPVYGGSSIALGNVPRNSVNLSTGPVGRVNASLKMVRLSPTSVLY